MFFLITFINVETPVSKNPYTKFVSFKEVEFSQGSLLLNYTLD